MSVPLRPPLVEPTMRISEWKELSKNTLKAAFTLTLPSGLAIHDVMLHEREGRRWIALPGVPYESNGEKKWKRILEFSSKDVHARFQRAALKAVEEHLNGGAK